jgi:hypothetical protein
MGSTGREFPEFFDALFQWSIALNQGLKEFDRTGAPYAQFQTRLILTWRYS